jgi:hypothetical protein
MVAKDEKTMLKSFENVVFVIALRKRVRKDIKKLLICG